MTGTCPLCNAPAPPPFLVRGDVPVHQNRTAATAAEARAMPRGRLEMVACEACGFVFNRAFAGVDYGPGYDNSQSCSAEFSAHLDALVRHLVEERHVRGQHVIEIGCGQGDFLRRLLAVPGAALTATGYDPACTAEGTDALRFERCLYGPGCAENAGVVLSRHVIEHAADPLALLRAVRAAAPAARVFCETPDVAWTFRNGVLWDMFYEHCSLFAAPVLEDAFGRAGYRVSSVRHVFGGQYLWLEAEPALPSACPAPGTIAAEARAFGALAEARIAAWRQRLAGAGKIAVWGAGAKGATFAALADPDATAIDCLVDINPAKQGRFLAGTGHPIVAPSALAARLVRHVLPVNPAYTAEIAAQLPPGASLLEWAD